MANPFDTISGGMNNAPGGAPMDEDTLPDASQTPVPDSAMQPSQEYEGGEDEDFENIVDFALEHANLAKKYRNKKLDDGTLLLDKMGAKIIQGINDDLQSRQAWMDQNDDWLKLALLLREVKTWPWPRAANVKYPLVATAAMQFSARAYPALVPQDGNIVKTRVQAGDQQGLLEKAAIRVSKHMSYQIMCQMPNWEEDMDKLLMTLAISGSCFKKTYHDVLENKHKSCLVYPENFVVNYYAKSLETAYRKTEILEYYHNEYLEKVNDDEVFLDIDLSNNITNPDMDLHKQPLASDLAVPAVSGASPHVFFACHTFWDLDNDGYEEPYIITVHKNSGKVVRITARWDSDGVYKKGKKIIKITPVESYTDFTFIPNPDGSIYGSGFGLLLGPLNEAINTIINQLIDSGTLNNLQSGFIGKNLRIKMGETQLKPGEWKVVNATGEDLQKSFFPLPTKEPSSVLYELLNMLIQSGNQLASIAEIFVGKMPGQNTPATTTQETIQQGMAVFTAIYKRVYRSLQKEFKKIFRLNKITPGIMEEEMTIAGEQIQQSDYNEQTEHLIVPGADPTGDSATVRMQKMQQVGQLLQLQTINPMVYTQRTLEAVEVPNWQELIMQPQPQPPDPKVQTEQMKQQTMQQKAQLDGQAKQQDMENKKEIAQLEAQLKVLELQFKQQELALKIQGQKAQMQMDQVAHATEMQHDQQRMQMETQIAATQAQSDIQTNEALNKQKIEHGEQQHQQKMKQSKQKEASKPNGASK